MRKVNFLALTVVLLSFSIARATISWSNPDGSAALFDWANGQSLNGLFGDPVLVGGNTLVFSPSLFRAESLDRQTNSVYDKLEFELIVHPGFSLQSISITEYGDYGILGNGQIEITGGLTIDNLETSESLTSALSTTPEMPVNNDTGQWQASTQLIIGSADCSRIRITLENNLFAVSGAGSAAWIENKVVGCDAIAFQIIPEPATIATLSIGALLILGCRRKKQHKAKFKTNVPKNHK